MWVKATWGFKTNRGADAKYKKKLIVFFRMTRILHTSGGQHFAQKKHQNAVSCEQIYSVLL